jgi:peptidoglycan/LPS O-acetylase OafA/YrhL
MTQITYPFIAGLFALFLFWIQQRIDHPLARFFAWQPVQTLGVYSYGIYMWHVISNACLAAALQTWAPHSFFFSSAWMRLASSLAAALGFAFLSRHLIEQPFLKLKSRFRPTQNLAHNFQPTA